MRREEKQTALDEVGLGARNSKCRKKCRSLNGSTRTAEKHDGADEERRSTGVVSREEEEP
ncbi:hypothetical protein L195_g018006 [Trifolium pratense]|uniref:Uncharacterized protein n=1 Tax=Trifolium pratense TaxID=57577 RepID=A0A2K3MVK0_TRIPR|nr:hypothetical protein L195_g018006 [Trifolium pratense]